MDLTLGLKGLVNYGGIDVMLIAIAILYDGVLEALLGRFPRK